MSDDTRRVKSAYTQYKKAKDALNALVTKHHKIFDQVYELTDKVNMKRKRLDVACREAEAGIGPVTVTRSKTPEFDVEYIEKILIDSPELVEEVIKIKKTVVRPVFDQLVEEGDISKRQEKRAITGSRTVIRLSGMPDEIVMP